MSEETGITLQDRLWLYQDDKLISLSFPVRFLVEYRGDEHDDDEKFRLVVCHVSEVRTSLTIGTQENCIRELWMIKNSMELKGCMIIQN